MNRTALLIACALPLAACNKSPEINEKNASVEKVARDVRASGGASDFFMHAGQWRITSSMDEMNIPNMPAEAQAEMKQVMGKQRSMSFEYCLSPEEAKKPRGKFFTGKEASNCRYDHFTMGGGKIDAEMHCKSEPSGQMVMNLNGTYSPDAYSTQVSMEMQGGREATMTMKMHSDAKRIGECTPKRQG
jgi:hypothetical protein